MWHDNETEVDLVGYDRLVDTVLHLVKAAHLRPLTLGLFGDWGSGKTSILRMAFNALKDDPKYVCVWFSPWLHKDYDDVKSSLMVSVLAELKSRQPLIAKVGESAKTTAATLWNRLARRVDWFRLFGFAAKNVVGLGMLSAGHPGGLALNLSSLGELGHLYQHQHETEHESHSSKDSESTPGFEAPKILKDAKEEAEPSAKVFEQNVDAFRSDFEKLLRELGVTVVVFIDDIDRCLPGSIVDILEALKLFLAVPETDFIISADERVVRHAIETRYPEMSADAHRIGRDYLEKIVQMPVYIPPLTPNETETYLNLLTLQASSSVTKDEFDNLVTQARDNRKKATLEVAMSYGIAKSIVGALGADVDKEMQLVQNVADILCTQLEGNPRRIKRFFNTLYLRRHLAETRGVVLDMAVLAKLMVLEYFYEGFFKTLYDWQVRGDGVATELLKIEDALATGVEEQIKSVLAPLRLSTHESGIRRCLELPPRLSKINLAPYFYFCRDKIAVTDASARRLSQDLQEMLGALQSESEANRSLAVDKFAALSPMDMRAVYDVLLRQFVQDPRNDVLEKQIVLLAASHSELVPALGDTLSEIPATSIRAALALQIGTELSPLPAELRPTLKAWSESSNRQLSLAAKKVLTR